MDFHRLLAIPTCETVEPQGIQLKTSPFLLVNDVLEGSPAFQGGLRSGDKIVRFADVDAGKDSPLNTIESIVRENIGRPIEVEILRGDTFIRNISMTPHTWVGRGVLGCHFLPL